MSTENMHELAIKIGVLQTQVAALSERVEEIEQSSLDEHRKVHDIVVATSEAVRNLVRTIEEMKPLTDDYREKRAEARGAARLAGWLYTAAGVIGGALFFMATRIVEWLGSRPPGSHP